MSNGELNQQSLATKLYYYLKPLIPRPLQIAVRRVDARRKVDKYKEVWPIYPASGELPEGWRGWPDGKDFAVALVHDVELQGGHDKCLQLATLEKELGFVASFHLVPERYNVSPELRGQLEELGFEICVHGLKHDGKLYQTRSVFVERAMKINQYLASWNAVGFGSPAMQRNLEWIHDLNIEWDTSTFDTDPFEHQPVGVNTIFPFWVERRDGRRGYVEMPYTLVQDFTLFILLGEKNIDTWKRKVDWIAEHGGMVLVHTHPDYMHFGDGKPALEEYPFDYYADLLRYISENYKDRFWNPLPRDAARYARSILGPKK